MTLRCLIDGLLLPAALVPTPAAPDQAALLAYDGDEAFTLEAVEVVYYELVEATPEEMLGLQRARYRLLRHAADFRPLAG